MGQNATWGPGENLKPVDQLTCSPKVKMAVRCPDATAFNFPFWFLKKTARASKVFGSHTQTHTHTPLQSSSVFGEVACRSEHGWEGEKGKRGLLLKNTSFFALSCRVQLCLHAGFTLVF